MTKTSMIKTSILAALPLMLSLAVIPAAQAQPAQATWRDAYGSAVAVPHRTMEPHWQMHAMERPFASPLAVQPQDHATDPFADLHLE